MDCVVVGSFNVDHVWHSRQLPQPGETRHGRYHTGPGGKGFNQAVAAARAGAATSFVCALGDDEGGRSARALARQYRLDLRALDCDEPTGTAGIYVDDHGRNSIVIGAGANGRLSPAHVAAQADALAAARIVLAQLESPLDAVLEAMRMARANARTTLLNPAPANAECPRELLAAVDILTPNETEFAALLAHHTGRQVAADGVAALDPAQLHALCRQLLPRGSVVVTLGERGAFVSHREDSLRGDADAYYLCDAAAARPVDTTGAGDAFNGSLAAALAMRPALPFQRHVVFAARFAALSTEREGAALSMPTGIEVEQRYGPLPA